MDIRNIKKLVNNKVVKYGSIGIITTLLARAVNFISIPIFTRLLTTSEYGSVDFFFSVTNMLYLILGFAASHIVERGILDFKEKLEQYISATMNVTLINTVIITLLANVFYYQLNRIVFIDRCTMNIMILYSYMLFIVSYKNMELNYQFQYGRNMYYTLSILIANVGLSVIFITVGLFDSAYWDRIFGALFPTVIIGAATFFLYQKKGGWNLNKKFVAYTLKYALPLLPHNLSLLLLSNADRIMIKSYFGVSCAAVYAVAYTTGILLGVVSEGVNKIYLPVFFRKMAANAYKDIRYYQVFIVLGMCMVTSLVFCISPELIYVFGGNKYTEGQQLINWIVLATFINFLYTTIYYNMEYYYKKTMLIAAGTIISTIINIVLNVIFMPIYGYQFGVASTVVSYLILLLGHMIIVKKTTEKELRQDCFILVILGVMFFETWVMQGMVTLLAIRIIVGILFAAIFAICLFVASKKAIADSVKFTIEN